MIFILEKFSYFDLYNMGKVGKNSKKLIVRYSGYAAVCRFDKRRNAIGIIAFKDKKKLHHVYHTLMNYVIFFTDQLRKFHKSIDKAASTDVLSIDQILPAYICIEDPLIQEQIEAGNLITKERLKLTRIHRWLNDKIEESFIFRNWYSYKKNLAWRFLRLAKDDNRGYRLRAVRSLATLNNLTDADYHQLAQSCDVKTAVGLARSTNNMKFFLDPPYYKQKPDLYAVIKHLHDFLLALDNDAKHPCLQYFISKVFSDIPETDYKGFDDDVGMKYNQNEFIPLCIEALLHHSWIGSNAKHIVTLGGLPLLTEVYKLIQDDPDNTDCLIMLSRLISNISVYENCLADFFVSGWIKILVALSQHKDIRVAAPAQRALINFDVDDELYGGNIKYHRSIYPLYPTLREKNKPKLDVIFIHGLLGGVFITWRQRDSEHACHKSPLELLGLFSSETGNDKSESKFARRSRLENDFLLDVAEYVHDDDGIEKDFAIVLSDLPVDSNTLTSGPYFSSTVQRPCDQAGFSKCWPRDWLSVDCPDVRIIGVNYETNISMWTPMCPTIPGSRNLHERSTHIMHALAKAGVGKRPIIWVGHSMGGLIVKDMLVQASSSDDPQKHSLFENTKGIVFYSTPHKGSHLAALNPTSQMIIWPSVEVKELRENSPALLELHKNFLQIIKKNSMKVVTFAERESTYITSMKFEVRFVDASSADPDVGEMYGIPLDHLSICKPACRQSFLYQKVLKLIKEVLQDIESPLYRY